MGKAVTIVLSGLAGAAIGGCVVYVCLDRKFEKIFNSEVEARDSEIESLRNEISTLQKKVAVKNETEKEKRTVPNNAVVPSVDPNSLIFAEDGDGTESSIPDDDKSLNDIRFISKRDYEDDDDYEKEEIEYYMFDGVITQDDEVLESEEFEAVCGTTVLPLLRKDKSLARWSSAGDNEIYIRNENYCTDYKVSRHHKAYEV